jgi:hypothetical protein
MPRSFRFAPRMADAINSAAIFEKRLASLWSVMHVIARGAEGLGSLVMKRNPRWTWHCGSPSAPVWRLTLRHQRWFPSAPRAISHRLGQDFSKTEPFPGQQIFSNSSARFSHRQQTLRSFNSIYLSHSPVRNRRPNPPADHDDRT